MTKEVLFIRHGQTAGNIEKRYVGRTDEPLCELGRTIIEEKRRIFETIKKEELILAVSPMKRCIETAAILFPDVKPIIVDDFREMDFGAFEYKNYKELEGNPDYQRFIDSNGTTGFPNAEGRAEFSDRCCQAFERFCCEYMQENEKNKWIFVVHGGTIMSILERYESSHKDFYEWQIGPGEGVFCELESDTKHTIKRIKVKKSYSLDSAASCLAFEYASGIPHTNP